jgi:hypothetical protein
VFIHCEQCGKKLIFLRDDGTLVFRFGKSHKEKPIVDMEIVGEGTISLKCLRRNCEHVMELDLTSLKTKE